MVVPVIYESVQCRSAEFHSGELGAVRLSSDVQSCSLNILIDFTPLWSCLCRLLYLLYPIICIANMVVKSSGINGIRCCILFLESGVCCLSIVYRVQVQFML